MPLEIKSGVTGKMKSMRFFLQKKNIQTGKRCSLENFGTLQYNDSDGDTETTRTIFVHPLYCMATICTI